MKKIENFDSNQLISKSTMSKISGGLDFYKSDTTYYLPNGGGSHTVRDLVISRRNGTIHTLSWPQFSSISYVDPENGDSVFLDNDNIQ